MDIYLKQVARTARAATAAEAALDAAIIEAHEAGLPLRKIAAATGGRVRSPESIRNLIRRKDGHE